MSNLLSTAEAANRIKCTETTIKNWVREKLLVPAQDRNGHGPGSGYRFKPADVDRAAKRGTARVAKVRKQAAARARKGAAAKRADLRGVSATVAAAEVGLSRPTIIKLHRIGYLAPDGRRRRRLPALSEKPLRFALDVVKGYVTASPITKDDLPIFEIAQELDGRDWNKESQRVYNMIRLMKLRTYRRHGRRRDGSLGPVQCIARKRVVDGHQADNRDDLLKRLNPAHDEQRPDELGLRREAEKEFRRTASQLKELLAKHAPGSGRTIKVRHSQGVTSKTVYPRAAIEAALRGEAWPAATNGSLAQRAAKATPITNKGGRPKKWAALESVILGLGLDTSNPEIVAAYHKRWGSKLAPPGAFIPRGCLPRATPSIVRTVKHHMRSRQRTARKTPTT